MPFFQPTIPEFPETLDLADQVAVVTGATAGIGRELSLQLLRFGTSHLIIGARNLQKGFRARLELLSDPAVQEKNPKCQITVLELDLARFDSVTAFASEVMKASPRLDMLVLCAGINLAHFEKTGDGNELCMQVNVLSNSLLSFLLLPVLVSTSQQYYATSASSQRPTMTWVGSMGQALHSPSPGPAADSETAILPYLASPRYYSAIRRYPDTKLFVSLIVRELAQRPLPPNKKDGDGVESPVIVNCVCPGTVRTGADNNLPFWLRIPMNANRALRGRSVEEGARAVLWALKGRLHEEDNNRNSYYIANNATQQLPPFADTVEGKDFGRRLFEEVLRFGKTVDDRIAPGLFGVGRS